MHLGKTVLASAAAVMPLAAAGLSHDKTFEGVLQRQSNSPSNATLKEFPEAIAKPIEKQFDPQNSVFSEQPHLALLRDFAHHGDGKANIHIRDVTADRMLKAESIQALKANADSVQSSSLPYTLAYHEHSFVSKIEMFARIIIASYKFEDGSLQDVTVFTHLIYKILKDTQNFSQNFEEIKRAFLAEVSRQEKTPLTEQQHQELLYAIAQIEAEHQNSPVDDFKALARSEVQNFVMAWLSSQIRQHVINRLTV